MEDDSRDARDDRDQTDTIWLGHASKPHISTYGSHYVTCWKAFNYPPLIAPIARCLQEKLDDHTVVFVSVGVLVDAQGEARVILANDVCMDEEKAFDFFKFWEGF